MFSMMTDPNKMCVDPSTGRWMKCYLLELKKQRERMEQQPQRRRGGPVIEIEPDPIPQITLQKPTSPPMLNMNLVSQLPDPMLMQRQVPQLHLIAPPPGKPQTDPVILPPVSLPPVSLPATPPPASEPPAGIVPDEAFMMTQSSEEGQEKQLDKIPTPVKLLAIAACAGVAFYIMRRPVA